MTRSHSQRILRIATTAGLAFATVGATLVTAFGGIMPKSYPSRATTASIVQLPPTALISGEQAQDGTNSEQVFGSVETISIGQIPTVNGYTNNFVMVNAGGVSDDAPEILADGKPVAASKAVSDKDDDRYLVSSNDLLNAAGNGPDVELTVAIRSKDGSIKTATEDVNVDTLRANPNAGETYAGLNTPIPLSPETTSFLKADFGVDL